MEPGRLAEIAQLVSALAGLAWPGIVLCALFLARGRLVELLNALIDKVHRSTDLKIGMVELKGALVDASGDVIKGVGGDLRTSPADAEDVAHRNRIYADLRGFMLVHTVRPVRPKEEVNGMEVFDVSIYLHAHAGRAAMNDVRRVAYFLGDKFGKSAHGSKWEVSRANDDFAFSIQAYGSFLCVAEVTFHDGTTARTHRYIDTEMLPVYG